MAANAPYYQLRGQFTNGTNAQFAPDVDDYDLSASLAPRHASVYGDTQASDTQVNTLEENHNLVELLEAATTAAGQAAEAMNVENASSLRTSQNRGKRKRASSPPAVDVGTSSHKRTRTDVPTDPQLQAHGADAQDAPGSSSIQSPGETLLSDARAAGVHSAAALFRPSSKETTRKYTRPPMSKLFMSLQLTPENFLHLQAQAKTYMLDPAHPDRQNCVGNRGKGDTDMVKLRLFNCVRDFLNDGAGEQFFGENVEKPAEKDTIEAARALGEEKAAIEAKLIWPRDGSKIVSLVTPLLRRMVTNERQRMYAIETRKGGAKKTEASVAASSVHDQSAESVSSTGSDALRTAFHNSHPLAHNQHQYQHSQLSTPVSSSTSQHFPDHNGSSYPPFQRPSLSITNMSDNQSNAIPAFEELALPTQQDRRYDLREIFVVLTKAGLKLKQQEKITERSPLDNFTWTQLSQVVHLQIRLALATYPELRNESHNSLNEREIEQGLQGMGPEALQGLAVAATEIQKHVNTANNTSSDLTIGSISVSAPSQQASTSASAQASASLPPPVPPELNKRDSFEHDGDSDTTSTHAITPRPVVRSAPNFLHETPIETASSPTDFPSLASVLQEGSPQLLAVDQPSTPAHAAARPNAKSDLQSESPKYVIKAMLTSGLVEIKDHVDWQSAKDDIGYSVWADGRLTVVVEFI